MIDGLPEAFIERMRGMPEFDFDGYVSALSLPYARGLRRNPKKPCRLPCEWDDGPIPWEPRGMYIDAYCQAGSHVLHDAGAYYLQEPSAMAPVAALAPTPGECVLDLCAAPGGKSTQIAARMRGEGLLVANEPIPSRAATLSRNIERMGVTNALVTCMQPDALAGAWGDIFTAILVDAPCSGEGMFRRHPETRLEWNEASPSGCAARQAIILDSAARMLRPGGRLVYSTCTFSREENEDTVNGLLKRFPELYAAPFELPGGLFAKGGMLRLYPHTVRGEGHFMALIKKRGEAELPALPPPECALAAPQGALVERYEESCAQLGISGMFPANAALGEALICAPPLPPLRGVRALRAGVTLGGLRGKTYRPNHALAMALPAGTPGIELGYDDARRYLRGEELMTDASRNGCAVATYSGLPLGFVKAAGGALKNHYPKALRRL